MIRHETQVRVRYRDTDKMGVVYHAVYLEFFETGRTEMMRDYGLSYASIEANGVMFPLLEAYVKMMRPARYDDLLTITSSLSIPEGARMRIDYQIHCNGTLLVSGFTAHAFTTVDTMRPVRPPKAFLEMLAGAEGELGVSG
jgi:acyl-CoA thioester hydrolase